MSQTISIVSDNNLSNEINSEHIKAQTGMTAAVESAFNCGYLLDKQKVVEKEAGREWLAWLHINCKDIPERTARGYMSLSRKLLIEHDNDRQRVSDAFLAGTIGYESIRELLGAKKSSAHVEHNSGEHEWYTPECFIVSARLVMGSIDTDPATSEKAQETVQAETYYTVKDNGLSDEIAWHGNVWMNPPYQAGLIDKFIKKMHESDIRASIVLVNNSTDTAWFSLLMNKASAVCFPTGRVKFLDEDGNPGAPLQGQAIVYRGSIVSGFVEEFSQYGFCLTRV